MKLAIFLLVAFLFLPLSSHAQEELQAPSAPTTPDTFYTGRVTRVLEERKEENLGIAGAAAFTQTLKVHVTSGPRKGAELEMKYGGLSDAQKMREGDKIIIIAPGGVMDTSKYYIFDLYRLPWLYLLMGIFVLLIIILVGWQGIKSLIGLSISIGVLGLFIIPRILSGDNALFTILIGSLLIASVSIYFAHGFNRRTSIALVSTLITIVIAIATSFLFVYLARLFGMGAEEAMYLQTSSAAGIDLQGLLLGGIIVGVLGVLDDVTTTQAAAVDEIAKANPLLTSKELFTRGLSVGREHITSLVNTLALAYAGASFPTLLLFTIYQRPFWVVMNTEAIAEEVVRTFVGSIALVCAVPIATFLAALFLSGKNSTKIERHTHITH